MISTYPWFLLVLVLSATPAAILLVGKLTRAEPGLVSGSALDFAVVLAPDRAVNAQVAGQGAQAGDERDADQREAEDAHDR